MSRNWSLRRLAPTPCSASTLQPKTPQNHIEFDELFLMITTCPESSLSWFSSVQIRLCPDSSLSWFLSVLIPLCLIFPFPDSSLPGLLLSRSRFLSVLVSLCPDSSLSWLLSILIPSCSIPLCPDHFTSWFGSFLSVPISLDPNPSPPWFLYTILISLCPDSLSALIPLCPDSFLSQFLFCLGCPNDVTTWLYLRS